MLYWKANFQIPNSGTQAAEVFVEAETTDGVITAKYYAEKEKINFLFEKTYEDASDDPYQYLLSLPEYEEYTKA